MNFPPVPPEVKSIAHFLKIADEHQERNVVVSYWCCMYACQYAMKTVPGAKPPEVTKLLMAIMDWLEKTKQQHGELEGITNDATAQALIEEYSIKLFNYAEAQDEAEVFDKNTIKVFYTCGILMDVLQQFGDLSEDIYEKRKYAKWRAAYIHNCLKNGEPPISGNAKIIYTKEEEDNFKDFLPKDEYDRLRENKDANGSGPSTSGSPPKSFPAPSWPAPSAVNPINPQPGISSGHPEASYVPPSTPVTPGVAVVGSSASLGPEQMEKAQKYCKWAASALNYDDVNNAVDNLQKALHLLQFGKEM